LTWIKSRHRYSCEKPRMTAAAPFPSDTPSAAPDFDTLALARQAARYGLRAVLGAQMVRTVLRLGFSASAATLVGRLVMQQPVPAWLPGMTVALLQFVLLAGLIADRLQATAETGVADTLRTAAIGRLQTMPARQLQALPAGALVVSLQRHPDAVAALVVGHRAAGAMMAAGPLIAAAALFLVSWQAALLMLALTPVMILFFALVGEAIRRRADAQERAFGKLAGQFADRLRTLPTIIANHALVREDTKLAGRLEAYAANAMGVLRVAFVNAAIIDFFASLSIAILAVFLGLGHLKLAMIPGFSSLELWQSLFILMIAPDYFAPFRRFSEQYHAKAEGAAAAVALDRLLAVDKGANHAVAAIDRLRIAWPERGLVAIIGPSGSGKSTLLRRAAGIEPGPVDGAIVAVEQSISWISTDSYVRGAILRHTIAGERVADPLRLDRAAGDVGLLDDALLPGGLNAPLLDAGANLSGGQRLRVSVARALLAEGAVLADEPTAKLDAATAGAVRRALRAMAETRLVVVATHDPELARLADRTIDLARPHELEVAA